MINIKDRTVESPNRYKLAAVEGLEGVYELEPAPGAVAEAGTPINRSLLMAMQGFAGQTTVFNADGSITATNQAGDTMTTAFNADGSITETFTAVDGQAITKTTVFQADGSIREVME